MTNLKTIAVGLATTAATLGQATGKALVNNNAVDQTNLEKKELKMELEATTAEDVYTGLADFGDGIFPENTSIRGNIFNPLSGSIGLTMGALINSDNYATLGAEYKIASKRGWSMPRGAAHIGLETSLGPAGTQVHEIEVMGSLDWGTGYKFENDRHAVSVYKSLSRYQPHFIGLGVETGDGVTGASLDLINHFIFSDFSVLSFRTEVDALKEHDSNDWHAVLKLASEIEFDVSDDVRMLIGAEGGFDISGSSKDMTPELQAKVGFKYYY